MNAITKHEAMPAELQKMTINPEQYVIAVYEPFQSALAAALADEPAEPYDVATTAGMGVAVARRAVFRKIRVATEKARAERKAPILEIGRLLDSTAKQLIADVVPHEEKHDAAIKAEEKRKAEERAERERIERERIAGLRARIADMQCMVVAAAGKSSADIEAMLSGLMATDISLEEFAEITGEAIAARDSVAGSLNAMIAGAKAQEAERTRLAEEAAKLKRERLAAEQAEADAKALRDKADAEARAELSRQQAAQAEAAATLKRQQDEFDARQAEFKRQQDEAEAKQKAEQEARDAVRAPTPVVGVSTESAAVAPAAEAAAPAVVTTIKAEADTPHPTNEEILMLVANHFGVSESVAYDWLVAGFSKKEAA